jgi:hypothetical protein
MIFAGYVVAALAFLSTAILAAWIYAHPEQHNRFTHDAPVMIMYILGAWLFLPLGWIWSVAFIIIVLLCNLWFVMRVCPHCAYHGRLDGPSVYCVMSIHLSGRREPQHFAHHFRQNVGISVVSWVLPVIGGVIALRLLHDLTYGLVLLAAFGVIAFLLVPMAARPNCERCLNREACPYGGNAAIDKKQKVP